MTRESYCGPFSQAAAIVPHLSPEDLGRLMALSMAMVVNRHGVAHAQAMQKNIWAALPEVKAPENRVLSIITQVAARHGLEAGDLKGASRKKYISDARQEAMAALSEAGLSTTAIGRALGGRDHSTVIKGLRSLRKKKMERENGLR